MNVEEHIKWIPFFLCIFCTLCMDTYLFVSSLLYFWIISLYHYILVILRLVPKLLKLETKAFPRKEKLSISDLQDWNIT